MKKIILFSCVVISLLSSCKPNYVCKCYANGDLDTTIYMGEITLNQANKNCESVNSIRPGDSCRAMEGLRK